MIKKFLLSHHNYDLSKRWYIRYITTDKAGRAITKKIYEGINHGKTVEERMKIANTILDRLETEGVKVKTILQNEIKISFYAALEIIRPTLRRKTFQCYRSKINIFSNWCEANKINKIRHLNQSVFIKFLNYLLNKGNSHASYNDYKTTLKYIGSFVPELDQNTFDKIKKLSQNSVPAAYFQDYHIKILEKKISAENPQLWLVCQFIYYTLIRPGELRQIKIGDINLQNGTILVRADISKNKKTENVAIPNQLLNVLIEQNIFDYPTDFYLFGSKGCPSEGMRKVNYFQTKHLKILESLKFDTKRFKLYSWKHTGAVNMVRSGVHIKYIQIQGRWHDLDQVNSYLRQMGMMDMTEVKEKHTM